MEAYSEYLGTGRKNTIGYRTFSKGSLADGVAWSRGICCDDGGGDRLFGLGRCVNTREDVSISPKTPLPGPPHLAIPMS